MFTQTPKIVATAGILALCGFASAYTITGSVSNSEGAALKGVAVSLLKEGKSATTDDQGKFSIHEDETDAIHSDSKNSVGYIGINNGILSYSQGSSKPVQVRVYSSLGNLVFQETLQGAGTFDLGHSVKARGTYFAQVSVGSAKQNFKFTTDGGLNSTIGTQNNKGSIGAFLKEAAQGEAIRFAAEGFDTLTIPLGTLDTTLDVKLTATAPQFKFGYALGNVPTPSKGCGTTSKLQKVKSVENGDQFQIKVGTAQGAFRAALLR